MAVSPDKEVILKSGRSDEQEEQPASTWRELLVAFLANDIMHGTHRFILYIII